jgi:hypothetical protein
MSLKENVAGEQPQSGNRSGRKYERIELPKGMIVAWQGGGRREVARISSLSLGGVFIRTPVPPAAGTFLQMVFEIPGGDIRARGTVVYSRPDKGMGVQFRGMEAEQRARLAQLLKRLLR